MLISSSHTGLHSPQVLALQPSRSSVDTPVKSSDSGPKTEPISAKHSEESVIRPPSVRSTFAVDPTRELRPLNLDPRHAQIAQTFLDIAHYEESFHLVDVFA